MMVHVSKERESCYHISPYRDPYDQHDINTAEFMMLIKKIIHVDVV